METKVKQLTPTDTPETRLNINYFIEFTWNVKAKQIHCNKGYDIITE